MLILTEEQARKLIKTPKNHGLLKTAQVIETYLSEFFYGAIDNKSSVIISKYEKLLPPQKRQAFRENYNNPNKVLLNTIKQHYNKIFDAQGKKVTSDFKDDKNQDFIEFQKWRKTCYEGVSDDEFYKLKGIENYLTQPNSVYLTVNKENEAGEVTQSIKHIPLSYIYDVDSDISGINYIIISKKIEKDLYYYVYDSSQFFKFQKVNDNLVLVDYIQDTGTTKCPAVFVSSDNLEKNNYVLKKNTIIDSKGDMFFYAFSKTCYDTYKMSSSYPKEIVPQLICDYENEEYRCDSGVLVSIEDDTKKGGDCPKCKSRYRGTMGEIVEIPMLQQESEFISNIPNLYYRLETDTNILTFHSSDIDKQKDHILNSVIGIGFNQPDSKNIAKNQTQVLGNFDNQEAVLNTVKAQIENTWTYSIDRAGEMGYTTFVGFRIDLGNKFFLKTTEQLYSELNMIIENGGNFGDIEAKKTEILHTQFKNHPEQIVRHKIINVLQPFSGFTPEYVSKNRSVLDERELRVYDNFNRLLSLFELSFGNIELLGSTLDTIERFTMIKQEFTNFTNKYFDNGSEE